MKLERLKEIVKDGRFFGVRFIKRGDGQERTMCARIRAPVPGSSPHYDPDKHDLLTVWDIHKKGWRNIPADNIVELHAHGQKYRGD